jgi:DNA-binding protein HU-beta
VPGIGRAEPEGCGIAPIASRVFVGNDCGASKSTDTALIRRDLARKTVESLALGMDQGHGLSLARNSNSKEGRTMNNNDLADVLSASHDLSKADARKAVDAVFAAIADAASKGEEVSLNGFGKFKVKNTPAREGRNPSTGATIQIAAANKLTFAPAKAVKDKLNA